MSRVQTCLGLEHGGLGHRIKGTVCSDNVKCWQLNPKTLSPNRGACSVQDGCHGVPKVYDHRECSLRSSESSWGGGGGGGWEFFERMLKVSGT